MTDADGSGGQGSTKLCQKLDSRQSPQNGPFQGHLHERRMWLAPQLSFVSIAHVPKEERSIPSASLWLSKFKPKSQTIGNSPRVNRAEIEGP